MLSNGVLASAQFGSARRWILGERQSRRADVAVSRRCCRAQQACPSKVRLVSCRVVSLHVLFLVCVDPWLGFLRAWPLLVGARSCTSQAACSHMGSAAQPAHVQCRSCVIPNRTSSVYILCHSEPHGGVQYIRHRHCSCRYAAVRVRVRVHTFLSYSLATTGRVRWAKGVNHHECMCTVLLP